MNHQLLACLLLNLNLRSFTFDIYAFAFCDISDRLNCGAGESHSSGSRCWSLFWRGRRTQTQGSDRRSDLRRLRRWRSRGRWWGPGRGRWRRRSSSRRRCRSHWGKPFQTLRLQSELEGLSISPLLLLPSPGRRRVRSLSSWSCFLADRHTLQKKERIRSYLLENDW